MINEQGSIPSSNKEAPKSFTKWKTFMCRRRQDMEIISKEWIISGRVTFLWRMARVYLTDYLTSSDQEIPPWLIKITFLGEAETVIKIGVKYWFGDVALAKWLHLEPVFFSFFFFLNR